MPLTKAKFRSRLREELGDVERLTGTATGGSLTTIVDTARLIQPDNYWRERLGKVFIKTSTDGLAPQDEARRIAASSSSNKDLTVELPFSAAVESGDTYGLAIFSNARLDNVVSGTLLDFSDYRPLHFNENLVIATADKRYAPTSAAAIRTIEMIEDFDAATSKQIIYTGWIWDAGLKKIEFADWQTAKTLKIYATKSHLLPSGEATVHTYEDYDEQKLLEWCVAKTVLSMTPEDYRDDFGRLRAQSVTLAAITENIGDTREKVFDYFTKAIENIKKSFYLDRH